MAEDIIRLKTKIIDNNSFLNIAFFSVTKIQDIHGYISGSEIAASLGVTRAAIWKCIKQLESEGYEIEASAGNGGRHLRE